MIASVLGDNSVTIEWVLLQDHWISRVVLLATQGSFSPIDVYHLTDFTITIDDVVCESSA